MEYWFKTGFLLATFQSSNTPILEDQTPQLVNFVSFVVNLIIFEPCVIMLAALMKTIAIKNLSK